MFAIGDIQGCDDELAMLLARLPMDAPIICLGDLVNRGPHSLNVLRRLRARANTSHVILGNHDLHLLACAYGIRPLHHSDTFTDILAAPDREILLTWLRHQPLAFAQAQFLCVHAGVLPQWSVAQTLQYAQEIEYHLQRNDFVDFLAHAFSNQPDQWDPNLQGTDRLRLNLNVLTRLRFCTPTGRIDFSAKDGKQPAPPGYLPWFDCPNRQTADTTVVFGHWSTLGLLQRPSLIGLDTGCVWGGQLSAMYLSNQIAQRQLIQVNQQTTP